MNKKSALSLKKTKIVCTIGPSSSDIEVMKNLISAGMNVARINMSHGTHEAHAKNIKNLRKASKEVGKEIGILMDLQGPKIRVEKISMASTPTFLELNTNEEWTISAKSEFRSVSSVALQFEKIIPTSYKAIAIDTKPGQRVLFDDGLIEGIILSTAQESVKIKITVGGKLKSNKGINLPDSEVSAPSLTDKDKKDLFFGLTQDIDFIALSFVRDAEDVSRVKDILKKKSKNIPIISKIEKPEAVKNIDAISFISDGIMIARGDMAVEMGVHLVPKIQKQIIKLCNKIGKPVITATQMLESMTTNSSPTRAEATDVANAIWDGTDAVMLSGETASGVNPVNVVETMTRIILDAETLVKKNNVPDGNQSFTENIQLAGKVIAENLKASFILSETKLGKSVQSLSSFRPKPPIVALTDSLVTARKCSLMWGVNAFVVKKLNYDQYKQDIFKLLGAEKENVLVLCQSSGKDVTRPNQVSIKTV